MYNFIIKNLDGSIHHTSIRTFDNAFQAQKAGFKFMFIRSVMGMGNSGLSIDIKEN